MDLSLRYGLPPLLTWATVVALTKEGSEKPQKLPTRFGEEPVYKKGINKTMKFKSGGTTLLYNRCKYNGNMDNDCYTE